MPLQYNVTTDTSFIMPVNYEQLSKEEKNRRATTARWASYTPEQRAHRLRGARGASRQRHDDYVARVGEPKPCACGCGQMCVKAKSKFVPGHNVRVGERHWSEEGRKGLQASGRRTRALMVERGTIGWPKGVAQSVEHRQKNSLGVKKAIFEGRRDQSAAMHKAYANAALDSKLIQGRRHRGTFGVYHSKRLNKNFRYDSTWELARLETLEASAEVRSYKRTPVRLIYTDAQETEHYYFPDFAVFYTNGKVAIEEVKPQNLLNWGTNGLKIKALRKYCKIHNYVCRVLTSIEECKEII